MGNKINYKLEDNVVAHKCEELAVKDGKVVLQVAIAIKPRANAKVIRREFGYRQIKKLTEDADGYKLGKCIKSDRLRNYATKEKHLWGLFAFEIEEFPQDSIDLQNAIKVADKEFKHQPIPELPEDKKIAGFSPILSSEKQLTAEERAEWVKTTRTDLGMTQAQLSELCGYTANKISAYERGIVDISDTTFGYLRGALEIAHVEIVKSDMAKEGADKKEVIYDGSSPKD